MAPTESVEDSCEEQHGISLTLEEGEYGPAWNVRQGPLEPEPVQVQGRHKDYQHGQVPKTVDLQKQFEATFEGAPTTLMIRNIPNSYTQRELLKELESLGFAGAFDFLYMPVDKGTMSNVGYAFVNFVDGEWANRCLTRLSKHYRFKRHRSTSGKIARVSVAHIQGLEMNLRYYEKAAVSNCKLRQRRPVFLVNNSSAILTETSTVSGLLESSALSSDRVPRASAVLV
jgi:RNA recognition motif-containing protein